MSGREAALPLLFDAFDRASGGQGPGAPAVEPRLRRPLALARFEDGADEAGPALEILFPPEGAEVLVEAVGPQARGLSLAARGGAGRLSWYAEGRPAEIEPTSGRALWRPSSPGFHTVMVVDADGTRAQARVRVRLAR